MKKKNTPIHRHDASPSGTIVRRAKFAKKGECLRMDEKQKRLNENISGLLGGLGAKRPPLGRFVAVQSLFVFERNFA